MAGTVVHALRDVSFDIRKGEFVAVMGPSGSGKSTLMNLLGFLDRPTSGDYVLNGKDMSRMDMDQQALIRNRWIGFVFQKFNLLPRSTANENVELPLVYAGAKRAERGDKARSALDIVGLDARAHHWPHQLSGGEQQRVAIARAIVNDPVLLLADEPTGALDEATGLVILAHLQDLNRAGRTIVLVTHDPDVAQHCGRIISLRDGRLISDETVATPIEARTRLERVRAQTPPPRNRDQRTPWHDVLRMTYWESFWIAFRALRANALRSALTMLGIIIGVAAVITMIAVGNGAQIEITERIRALGANLLIVWPKSQTSAGGERRSGTRYSLTENDAFAISKEIPSVTAVSPVVYGRSQLVRGNRNWWATVIGALPDHLVATEWPVMLGGAFSRGEVARKAKVVLIGTDVAAKIFEKTDPLGKVIRIDNVPFIVVGVLAPKGLNARGRNLDDRVIVPLSTAKSRMKDTGGETNPHAVHYIYVKVVDTDAIDEAKRQIRSLMRQRHRLRPAMSDNFGIGNVHKALEAKKESARTMSLLLATLASVALVVGGISIMNIMLVSITERAREIGLRLAVGARRWDIRSQFLIEAMTLSLVGGLVGIGFGVGAAVAITQAAGWPIMITPGSIALAVGFSAAVGIFFGFYPANKASRLDPIETLRFE